MTARTTARITAEHLLPDLTEAERERALRVESVLPVIAAAAEAADEAGSLPEGHLKLLGDAGLLGLVVPEEYGGLGGGLRDLAATTYTLGTVCGSTALAFFFHCSSSSRGLLPLAALEAGLYDEDEAPAVRAFAEKVLHLMGTDKKAIGNFASEAVKASNANVLIRTTATRAEGGWVLNGEKSFGCLSGSADYYLVTARREDVEGLDALTLFLVPRLSEGSRPRATWTGLGMRASDNNGLVLEDCFVPDELSLAVPGAFTRATSMSRGSWVGNQIAIAAIYAGIAQGVWDYAMGRTMAATFADTGKPIASSPMHQVLIGDGEQQLAEAHLWLRRQIELEASDPPILPKEEVVQSWKLAKGAICEHSHEVALAALKMCGTSGALMGNPIGRAIRDTAMGLVQAFPAERGKLDLAKMIVEHEGWAGLTTTDSFTK
ncbi:acyl-CoA dehydrogenase [Nocardioides sp. Root1257]|uniref:acyl-CoA dehydrogenase family protein n=1 Tax=unclassified Nocardioides TaxID=2615069 RepID=UPI0006F63A83|nr:MULTISPECIES: acyl-CoA dehydrogenase family protein [unclassified Nocardioides]KQW53706.1 acyl-CoA dehydrogenase [Nocardioides sp. Root1257]KRC56392.1 acyl-CoA dehydrogenase [Nocardioides sp. Root224]